MMFLGSLLFLISVGGSYGNYDCYLAVRSQCGADLLVTKFPDSPEELLGDLETCRQLEQYKSCEADVLESCNDDENENADARKAATYLNTTCRENNPTFEALSSNLDCVKNVSKQVDGSCMGTFSESTMEAMREHVKPLFENEQYEHLHCLGELMYIGCKAMKFEHHCGERVGEAIADVLINFKTAPTSCTPEIMEEVFPLLEGLEDIASEEMQQWLRKRR